MIAYVMSGTLALPQKTSNSVQADTKIAIRICGDFKALDLSDTEAAIVMLPPVIMMVEGKQSAR